MRRGEPGRRSARGFTYIGLLALIVLIGLLLAAAGEATQVAVQREHEAELLWVGHQYRAAIGRYAAHYHRYPASLADLVGETAGHSGGSGGDATTGGSAGGPDGGVLSFRALRRLYRDPMTNSPDWLTIPSPDGRVMGVASAALRAPLKHSGFDDDDIDFDKAASYQEWSFVYQPGTAARLRRLIRPSTN